MRKVAIVGPGKVGVAMALLLQTSGYNIIGVFGKNPQSTEAAANRLKTPGYLTLEGILKEAEIVFITTPDRVIEQVCTDISAVGGFKKDQVVIHMSGALPAFILAKAREAGANVLALHPIQSFADLEQAIKNLPGSFFSMEGDECAVPIGKEIVQVVGGEYFLLDSSLKPLYHMGAVVASNFLVAVLHWAIRTYQALGMNEQQAFKALKPLVLGSLNNVEALGPVGALTGPIARGDIATVEKHLAALKEQQRQNEDIYKVLAIYTSHIALEKGTISQEVYQKMRQLLEGGTD